MKTHYLSPLLFLSCARKVMNTAANYLSWNSMLNSRQLYQYSGLHYELSVFHLSLKQHCEKDLFSQLVVPSTLKNENCETTKSKALWEFKQGLVHQSRSCLSLALNWVCKMPLQTILLFRRKAMLGMPLKAVRPKCFAAPRWTMYLLQRYAT